MVFFRKILSRFKESIFLNPIWISEHKLRSAIKSAIATTAFSPAAKWIDVGCGTRPYEPYFPSGSYIGVDIEVSGRQSELKAPDHYYDGRVLPFPDNAVDGVITTQVLEHVPNPRALLAEINRVVKPGGQLLISLPFVWQEHEEPYDFFRYTRFGIGELLKESGFEIAGISRDTGALETLAVTFNVYVIHNLVPPIPGFGRLISLLFCFPIQLLAIVLQRVLPDRGQLYLNLVIKAKKMESLDQR